MNNAAIDGGGGGGGDFDWGRLYRAAGRIQDLLAVVKGNELCRDYLQHANEQANGVPTVGYNYTTKPSDGSLAVDFVTVVPMAESSTDDSAEVYRQYDQALDQSFTNGGPWAQGISTYIVSLVEPLTEPSVAAMDTISQNLKAIPLWSLFPADFSRDNNGIGLSASLHHWQGPSARAFETFYNNIDDVGQTYAFIKDAAASWVDGCGALIAAVRTGLLEFLESIVEHLETICHDWVVGHGWDVGERSSGTHPVVKLAGVAFEIAEALPVVDKVVQAPGKAVEVAERIGDLKAFGGLITKYTGLSLDSFKPEELEDLEYTASTAEAIYQLVTSTIVDKHITPLQAGFDAIASERTTGLTNDINALKHPREDHPRSTKGQTFYPNVVPQSITTDPAVYE